MNIPEHSGPKLLPWQLDGEIWWGLLGTLLLPGAQTHPANPLPTVPLWCNVAEMFYLPVSELLKDSTLTNAGFPEIRLGSHWSCVLSCSVSREQKMPRSLERFCPTFVFSLQ